MSDPNLTAQEALKMAREANAIAKQLNEETKEQIAATRNMHDEMLLNQRRISFALCKLLPKQISDNIVLANGTVIGFVENDSSPEQLVGMNNDIAGALKSRDVFDIIHAINVLAMANTDVIHVFTSFSGHVDKFNVHANATDTCYQEGHPHISLINENVWLDGEDTLEKLLSIETQLTELIIEAREEAEAKAKAKAKAEVDA
ncbi:MAG: hypothetical protein HWE27_15720 [Gammaproteobacteria bacterium]|nr:hypothetical protein [Gammaproteobacteria bacterium]